MFDDFLNFLKLTYVGKSVRYAYMKHRMFSVERTKKAIREWTNVKASDEKYDALVERIQRDVKKFQISSNEWFMYEFAEKSDEEKSKFVPGRIQVFVCEKLNVAKDISVFCQKDKTYQCFGKYYKRDVLGMFQNTSMEDFVQFAEKHACFIAKPNKGLSGRGVQIYDVNACENAEVLYQKLLKDYPEGCVIEELVEQSGVMHDTHPSSLNTVRISTVRYDDRVEIIHPFAKFGQGGSRVDNGGAGGILCTIDPETGVIMRARDEKGTDYDTHPDTGCPIVGMKIPNWEDAVALAKELATVRPDSRFVGWDLATTGEDWLMIEGNFYGGFIGWQLVDRKGFKKELTNILKELHVKVKL